MVPRTDIHAISAATTLAELRTAFKRDLYSRTPVYLHDLDDILGILNYKEILRLSPADEAKFNLQDYLHPGLFVPETMSVGVLLNKMRERRSHLAIVIDEYGGTSGLVTFEDIVEVLVGRVEDEYDVQSRLIERRANGVWEVDGRLGIEELQETIGQDLSEEASEGASTAAGLALKAFGKIPSEGEETTYHSLRFKATRVRDQRVRRLEISKLEGFSSESVRISEHPLSDDTSVMPFPAVEPKTDRPKRE
jgi:CBS domain containing-hemolysin-like protein